MHLVHVVLRISWGSLWRVGVSRSRRSWAGTHHAVGWAWWWTRTWTHHASWRRPWAWGGSRPRCPSHWGVRSGHLSGESGNVCQQEVAASTPGRSDDKEVWENDLTGVRVCVFTTGVLIHRTIYATLSSLGILHVYWLIGNKGTDHSRQNKNISWSCWMLSGQAWK